MPVAEGAEVPFDLDRCNAAGPMMFAPDESGAAVVQVTDGFVRALAALPDERIAPVAAMWGPAEEWGGDIAPEELDEIVRDLRDLAREVRDPDQHLYVWWSL